MEKLKKLLKYQAIIFVITIVLILIGQSLYDYYQESQFEKLSKSQFIEVLENEKFPIVELIDDRCETTSSDGKKYFCLDTHGVMEELPTKTSTKTFANNHFFDYAIKVYILLICFFLNLLILWLAVFYNILTSEFIEKHNKIVWLIAVILLPYITPFFYIYVAENQQVK
jgi:hypothetical protein